MAPSLDGARARWPRADLGKLKEEVGVELLAMREGRLRAGLLDAGGGHAARASRHLLQTQLRTFGQEVRQRAQEAIAGSLRPSITTIEMASLSQQIAKQQPE